MRSGQAQRARISCKNLRRNFAAKSSFKTRQKSSKDQKAAAAKSSRRNYARKFLLVKLLWMGRDLNSRQILRAKFYAKICIRPAKFIVNFPGRNFFAPYEISSTISFFSPICLISSTEAPPKRSASTSASLQAPARAISRSTLPRQALA